jgi:hypothetical protein
MMRIDDLVDSSIHSDSRHPRDGGDPVKKITAATPLT